MTSATPATTGVPASSRIEYAETAPPLIGEDVLSRKIPDRGARQQRFEAPRPADEFSTTASPAVPSQAFSVPADAPRVLAGFLVSYEGDPLGQSWAIHQGANVVGRTGALAGAELELPHATVSSRHALLMASAHPGRMALTDFGSTNGTFVNDTALTPHDPRELRDGDRVRFGLLAVIIKII